MIAQTPPPPYWVVIFSAVFSGREPEEYAETAARMNQLMRESPGFLGYETAQGEGGAEITVCYWDCEEAVRTWKQNAEHMAAQKRGREAFYSAYHIRVGKVERAYGF